MQKQARIFSRPIHTRRVPRWLSLVDAQAQRAPVSSRLVTTSRESGRSRVRSPPEAPYSFNVTCANVLNRLVGFENHSVLVVIVPERVRIHFSPQCRNASTTGPISFPFRVKEYSTETGKPLLTFLTTIPLAASCFSVADRLFDETFGMTDLSSAKCLGPSNK